MNKKQKGMLIQILAGAVLLLAAKLIPAEGWLEAVLFLIPYLAVGWKVLKKAGVNILHGQVFDENFLMCVATLGAFAAGDYTEGVAVMLFFEIGELFESVAVGRSRQSISELMNIRPDVANVERGGELETVDPEEVSLGETIVIQPGERVPLDGTVLDGDSTLDTAALTGESMPRTVRAGDEVISGCINLSGVLRVKVEKEFGESTVSKILELVENSSTRKARAENFITRFARYYTPAVCFAALALAVIPPLVVGEWMMWIKRALTFLIVSCPCALVISIPLSFFGGIGGASRCGILVKGSNYMETLFGVDTVVFDKTGTLTEGSFRVTAVHPDKCPESELLELAALTESYSTHPISRSILEAYGHEPNRSRVTHVEEVAGHGVKAVVDGRQVLAGNERMMCAAGVEPTHCTCVGTIVHLAVDGQYAGHITISDVVKSDSREAIQALRRAGVKKTVMLTGDSEAVGRRVAEELGLDEAYCGLLPADKVAHVEELMRSENGKLAFVGDGINDAPVLARADIGIAMGALGSDAAIEAADVVLMNDKPSKIATAIAISRRTLRIVHENIVFSLAVKLVILVLSALGVTGMWWAVVGDVGVLVLAVLNAMRALRFKE